MAWVPKTRSYSNIDTVQLVEEALAPHLLEEGYQVCELAILQPRY